MTWRVERLPECPSTNAEALARIRAGEGDGLVVVTDHQTAGRGRLDRTWETPAGVALTFTAVVDPRMPDTGWPLLPLLTGVAVLDAVRRLAPGVRVGLKWPNDVLAARTDAAEGEDRKLAGILLERVDRLALLGVGVNVHQDRVPVDTATSLALLGAEVSRSALLDDLLDALTTGLERWRSGEPVLERYRQDCLTLGRRVTVDLPGGERFSGDAVDLDEVGRLVVATGRGRRSVAAGDVVHARL